MARLDRITNPDVARLCGYLEATQYAFMQGQYDMLLEAHVFRIGASDVTEGEIIEAAYPDANSLLDKYGAVATENMKGRVNAELSLRRGDWNPDVPGIPNIIEARLREGFWKHLNECFPLEATRAVECDPDTPYVNLGGFTYILFAKRRESCLLLVCNVMD
jgi:hypothetical protein